MTPYTRAILICRREALRYTSPRSARLASILWRHNRIVAHRAAAGRTIDPIRSRIRRIATAYLAALLD